MKFKKMEAALILGLIIVMFCGASLKAEQEELSSKLIRLHVKANSDSEEDQRLKLLVRDEITAATEELANQARDELEAYDLLDGSLDQLRQIAEDVLRAQGCDDEVSVTLQIEDFPTREYETFTLPAGKYMALRVTIGQGGGENWWCVVFPPLCLSATSEEVSQTAMSAGLTEEEVGLILNEEEGYVLKLKSMEWVESFLSLFE